MNKNNLSESDISDKYVRPSIVQAGIQQATLAEQSIVTRIASLCPELCQHLTTARTQQEVTEPARNPSSHWAGFWPCSGG